MSFSYKTKTIFHNFYIKMARTGFKELEPVQSIQINIDQNDTTGKHLGWLHFNKKSMVQQNQ